MAEGVEMKQPDRWERLVKERMETDGGIWSDSAADLLRKEHAWVMRMVLKELKTNKPKMDVYGQHCMAVQARDILIKLKERAR